MKNFKKLSGLLFVSFRRFISYKLLGERNGGIYIQFQGCLMHFNRNNMP